jgi:hypothetical protein
MAGNTLIGSANIWKTGSVSAGSSVSGLGPANLQGDSCTPSAGWQSANGVVTAVGGATLQLTSSLAGVTWREFGVFQTNLTESAAVTFKLWLTAGPTLVWSIAAPGPMNGYAQVVVDAGQDYVADYLTIDFDDSGNPDSHINVGGAFAGPAWQPLIGMSWNTTYGSTIRQARTQSRGGQETRRLLSRQRFWSVELQAVRDTEAWDDLAELDRIAALGGNVLLIPDITSADIYREAVFGPLDVVSDVSFPFQTTDARAWRGKITERL